MTDDAEGTLLSGLLARGRAACAPLEVPAEVFLRHLRERSAAAGRTLAQAAEALHVEDLYLACGCAARDPVALRLFEERYLRQVPRHLARLAPEPAFLDEVCQQLRTRLFVGDEAGPKILDYAGTGPLGGWLRVAAVRTALNLRRGRKDRSLSQEEPEPAVAGGAEGGERGYLKARYGEALQGALQEALRGLSSDRRAALRLHYGEGLTIEELGARLGVSRATAARRLAECRAAVQADTRRLLQQRLHLSQGELTSMIGLLRSQLALSIGRCLDEG